MKPASDTSARDRVLFQLKTKGAQSAAQLARRLGVTAVAVRQHLQRLEEEGLVAYEEERRPVGRPVKLWRTTEAADGRFPDAHADLTLELIDAIKATFGAEGLDRLVRRRSRQQRRAYRERMPPEGAPLAERVARLASLRREEGYMAEFARQRDGSFLLLENHCPICAAARVCQGFCRDELTLFRAVLGPDAVVERTDHILAGARRCAYEIRAR